MRYLIISNRPNRAVRALSDTRCRRTRGRDFGLSVTVLSIFLAVSSASGVVAAELAAPTTFSIEFRRGTGRTIDVAPSESLQAALDAAQPGDTIVLRSGATYKGPFTLPFKSSRDGWILVTTDAHARLPAAGTRLRTADLSLLSRIVPGDGGGPAIRTANQAHHFWFVGIEFSPQPNQFIHTLVRLGNADQTLATLPEHIVFDRCNFRGDPVVGGRRGIAMDGRWIAIIESRFSDFKERGADSQGLWAYNSPGPFKIVNNHIEAAGENVMFGGADPELMGVVPADIEIRRNHFFKPDGWRSENWVVKNLLEFKSAQRVLVEGNQFENVWASGQNGFAVVITPRNQDGGAPWTIVEDIRIRYNRFDRVDQGFNILGTDDLHPSRETARIAIEHNLFVTGAERGAHDKFVQMVASPRDVHIVNNTGFSNRAFFYAENSPRTPGFVFRNNIVTKGEYGFSGNSSAEGTGTLANHFVDPNFQKNAIVGASAASYPTNNFFPGRVEEVGFRDLSRGDYRLAADSPFKNAGTDGNDLGADIDAIDSALAGESAIGGRENSSEKPLPPSQLKIG